MLAVLGAIALIAAGRYAMTHIDSVAATGEAVAGLPAAAFFRSWVGLLPGAAAVGIATTVAGSFLIALVIGLPPSPAASCAPGPARLPDLAAARWPRLLFFLAACSAALAAVLLAQPRPGAAAVAAWLLGPAAALAGAVLVDRQRGTRLGNPLPTWWEWPALALITTASLVITAHDLGHWRWSGTLDEAYFFVAAKALAEGRRVVSPFSEAGVFGFHPVLSSYYQALFMRLFGMDVFGWRLSSAAALAAAVPFTYLLARALASRRAGLCAAALFGTAQLAVGYAHFGYNNAQVFPLVTAPLAVCAWSLARRSAAGYFLTGGLVGLGFFTYFTARMSLALVPLLVWGLGGVRRLWEDRAGRRLLVAGFLMTALPTLLRLDQTLDQMLYLTGITGQRRVAEATLPDLMAWLVDAVRWKVAAQWLLSIFHGVWSERGQFQWPPVVDPVTMTLAAVGLWLGARALVRRGRDFLLPAYLLCAFGVGALSPYAQPALTRLLLLAPFTSILAAATLDQAMRRIGTTADRERIATAAGGMVLAAAIAWNLAAQHHNVYHRYHGYPGSNVAELIRTVQGLPRECQILYVQAAPIEERHIDLELAVYGMDERLSYAQPAPADLAMALAQLRPPFVVAHDLEDPQQRGAAEGAVQRQFPSLRWLDSDGGQPWNLRYFYAPPSLDQPPSTRLPPSEHSDQR